MNLKIMYRLYNEYSIGQTLSDQLTWSHYLKLLSVGYRRLDSLINNPKVLEFVGMSDRTLLESDLEKVVVRLN